MTQMKVYKIGEELVSISVELQYLRMFFASHAIAFSEFKLTPPSTDVLIEFDMWERSGDLNVLWPLIGVSSSQALMDDQVFTLHFDNGVEMSCRNDWRTPELVNIYRLGVVERNEMMRYPADLPLVPDYIP
ncbi:MAG: hypothetical protein R3D51_17915 [Hyphomicrobiaceae bacterium]